MIAVCVDARGLEEVLTEGWEYEVERLPLAALRVRIDDADPEVWVVCCGYRFEIVRLP